ncbi:MAG: ADP-ribosylglycohydrolase family protein [Eubacteriales bacterium]|nr:ADP-ribosylglycohydrolase family protein [Eubacteriales bacterium]MDD4513866.1 ADP-ribosylglycohydrolase family protein [Eubacteriales bacterium]
MRGATIKCLEYLRTVGAEACDHTQRLHLDARFDAWHKAAYEDKGFLDYGDYFEHANACREKPVQALTLNEVRGRITFILRTARGSDTFLDEPIREGSLKALLERYLELTATGSDAIASGIFGMAVADAVGVPAEFKSREELRARPITDMIGGGAHQQVAGTWSDDTSMALCLVFSLAERNGIDADDIMKRFCDWYENDAYSPHGECFDIGMTVTKALGRYAEGIPADECGGAGAQDNGNGSLMRILPLVYHLISRYGGTFGTSDEAMRLIDQVSSLTHRHPISRVACGIYLHIATRLLLGDAVPDAVQRGVDTALDWYTSHDGYKVRLDCWTRIRDVSAFAALPEDEIRSGGYVVDTLEAALWCLLNTDNYRDCVLKAVNLGSDTDTVAAVVGGLAGIHYGLDGIPSAWMDGLQGKKMLIDCCDALAASLNRR